MSCVDRELRPIACNDPDGKQPEEVGWQHQLNGHEFEQTPGESGGQGSLVSCSPWGPKESNVNEQLINNTGKESEKE